MPVWERAEIQALLPWPWRCHAPRSAGTVFRRGDELHRRPSDRRESGTGKRQQVPPAEGEIGALDGAVEQTDAADEADASEEASPLICVFDGPVTRAEGLETLAW